MSPPPPALTLTSGRAQTRSGQQVSPWPALGCWPRAPMGSHPSSETRGEAVGWGERKKNLSRFLAARHPSALRHLNDITVRSV